MQKIMDCLREYPVIAAVGDDKWEAALKCPAKVIFYMSANLLTIGQRVRQAHEAKKYIMIHLDLAEGIGRDRTGIRFLAGCGVDGILSTRGQLIRMAREQQLFTVQRFFAVDSNGAESIGELMRGANPHILEIMPGVVTKVIRRYSEGGVPVIAGGLIQTEQEAKEALAAGAKAVSTGQPELWGFRNV